MTAEGHPSATRAGADDPEAQARQICLRLLDRRACTRSELAAALRRKGVPDDAADRVLNRYADVGLVDDRALADAYALAQHRERGLAGRAVARKLRQRGLDEDTVQEAVGQIAPGSERTAARALVTRRLPALRGLEPTVQARRLVALLGRRGYRPALAYAVVRDALADCESIECDAPIEVDIE
jgi:regulatory protein